MCLEIRGASHCGKITNNTFIKSLRHIHLVSNYSPLLIIFVCIFVFVPCVLFQLKAYCYYTCFYLLMAVLLNHICEQVIFTGKNPTYLLCYQPCKIQMLITTCSDITFLFEIKIQLILKTSSTIFQNTLFFKCDFLKF